MKRNQDFKKLTEDQIIERLSGDNYKGGNIGLPENPTLEERTKYKICKEILTYQQKNKLNKWRKSWLFRKRNYMIFFGTK